MIRSLVVFTALWAIQLVGCTPGDGNEAGTNSPAVVSSDAKGKAAGVGDGSEVAKLRAEIESLTKEKAELKLKYEECNELIKESKEFGDYLTRLYFEEKKHYFDGPKATVRLIRDDDPIIPASQGLRMTLVYFTDMTCPNCESFERYLKKEIEPLFKGHLRVVYKHSPRHDPDRSKPLHKALGSGAHSGAVLGDEGGSPGSPQ